MKVFFALGNPGVEYVRTRHNIGWLFLDELSQKLKAGKLLPKAKLKAQLVKFQDFILVKPTTYMNSAGEAAQAVVSFYRISDLSNFFLIYDDLDLELGKYKIAFGSHPKGHNGVNSVIESLGTDQFWSVRIGVESRSLENRQSGSDFVLENMKLAEFKTQQAAFQKILEEINQFFG